MIHSIPLKKIALIVLFLVSIGVAGAWTWWEYFFPLSEFSRLGDIQFPKGSKVLAWEHEVWDLKGKFQIPIQQVHEFSTANQLSDGEYENGEFLVAKRCIHEGNNYIDVRLDKRSGITEIAIRGPDHSGDKPCKAQELATP